MCPMGEHGQGSVSKRADGRLMVTITMLDGRRIWRYVPKDRDAKRQRRRAEAVRRELVAARERDLEPSTQTLEDYLRSWIVGLRDGRRVRPRTLEHYETVVFGHVIPGLGAHRIDRLAERHIQAWLDADVSAPRTVRHHHAVLRRALNVAVRQRIIERNPALNVELPDVADYRGEPLTVAEARALFAVGDRLSPLWRLAVATGLRESELLGLAWDDLDLDAGTVTARGQLVRAGGKWGIAPPKVARDHEVLHVDPATVTALREHQRRMAAERTPAWAFYGLVFVTTTGQPIGRSECLRTFHAACDAAGIARRRFHDLRGSSATFLQDAGITEAVRMARLGHVTKRMARHYAVVRDDLDREAAEALGRLLA